MISSRDLSVASYNIHKGIGTDRRSDLARTTAVNSEISADIVKLPRFCCTNGLMAGVPLSSRIFGEAALTEEKGRQLCQMAPSFLSILPDQWSRRGQRAAAPP